MTFRSVDISDELRRGIVGDVTLYGLTRPRTLVVWALLALVILLEVAGIATQAASGAFRPGLNVLVLLIAVAAPVLIAVSTRRAVSRSVAASYPVGGSIGAEVRGDALHVEAPRGTADTAYQMYSRADRFRGAVLLRAAGSRITTVLPGALLTDDDLATVRERMHR